MGKNITAFRLGALIFGFVFLYVPILSLIVYSFNKSRLVTVWGGFSTQWYGGCSRISRSWTPRGCR